MKMLGQQVAPDYFLLESSYTMFSKLKIQEICISITFISAVTQLNHQVFFSKAKQAIIIHYTFINFNQFRFSHKLIFLKILP